MDDLISRQAAIEEVHHGVYEFFDFTEDDDESPMTYKDEMLLKLNKAITSRLKELPSAQPEPQWIPCSERSPNEYGEYYFTWVTSYVPNKRFIGVAEYEVTGEWDIINGRWNGRWLFEDYMQVYPDVKVLAWMPLPEPWEGGAE